MCVHRETPVEQNTVDDEEQNSSSNKMKGKIKHIQLSLSSSHSFLLSHDCFLCPPAKLNQKTKQQQMTSDPKPPSCPPTSLSPEELEKEQEKVITDPLTSYSSSSIEVLPVTDYCPVTSETKSYNFRFNQSGESINFSQDSNVLFPSLFLCRFHSQNVQRFSLNEQELHSEPADGATDLIDQETSHMMV